MKYLSNLALLAALYVIGTLIFTGGFLLRRIVVQLNSTCTEDVASFTGKDRCSLKARHNKAVVIVIDALRYDFVVYNDSDGFETFPFQNKFKKLSSIMKNRPENSRLYRFVADPPTTTLQRLKGLTTGSLPTFVDAGSNFAKTEISEDNFIDQLRSANRSIVFMGDDTWTGLYPGRFKRSFPYPSFNVKDLHTVDDGVIGHLLPEMTLGGWDLLIAHLLGVDHCGHTFGPFHEAMAEKLTQMDDLIESVIDNLDDDAILFVMGDHGMTRTGDHGGDSDEEVEAALFVYSGRGFGYDPAEAQKYETTISQIDFVSTISLALDLPIPYQNLGIVISDLFRFCEDDLCSGKVEKESMLLDALRTNAIQVNRYLESYANLSGGFEGDDAGMFDSMFEEAEFDFGKIKESPDIAALERVLAAQSKYRKYLLSVRSFLRKKWAQFDLPSMFYGALIFVAALVLNLILLYSDSNFTFNGMSFAVVFSLFASIFLYFCGILFLSLIVALVGFLAFGFFTLKRAKSFDLKSHLNSLDAIDLCLVAIWIAYAASLLSNSYVVYEGTSTSFLLQSCLYAHLFCTARGCFSSAQAGRNPKKAVRIASVCLLIGIVLAVNLLLHVSRSFRACREEQVGCSESWLLRPRPDDNDDNDDSLDRKKNQFLFSMFSLLAAFFVAYRWLRRNGNANGWSPAVTSLKYFAFFSCLLVVAYWCLRSGGYKSSLKQLSSLAPGVAKMVYLCLSVSVALVVCFPLCTFVVKHALPSAKENLNSAISDILLSSSSSSRDVVPQIFRRLRANWMLERKASSKEEGEEQKIFVYGLATVFSAPLIVLLLDAVILLAMLLDAAVALSLFLMCVVIFLLLELHAVSFHLRPGHKIGHVSFGSVVLLLMLSCERFYSFGHHPTITSIRWEAAYHGFVGDFGSNFIPAVLVGLNTFASQFLVSLAIPLLVYWPFTRGRSWTSSNSLPADNGPSLSAGEDDAKGEFGICEESDKSVMSQLCHKTLLLCAVKMFGMMVCVTLHRRHLMVWKIFAPRFIYEAAAFFIMSAVCVFNYLFFLRTLRAADKFVSGLK